MLIKYIQRDSDFTLGSGWPFKCGWSNLCWDCL